jgi:hypothetical protein
MNRCIGNRSEEQTHEAGQLGPMVDLYRAVCPVEIHAVVAEVGDRQISNKGKQDQDLLVGS